MSNLKLVQPIIKSATDDTGLCSSDISHCMRLINVEIVIRRFFVGKFKTTKANLLREAVARNIHAGADFALRLAEDEELADGGFGPELKAPSYSVERAFRRYAQTELGAVALARLVEWDNRFIDKGWRERSGAITDKGFEAYGMGKWRPFRVASNGEGSDAVTPSGALVLPDLFQQELYTTDDIANPLAILHHEIKAHVLPLKAAEGLEPGREMELICVRLESEMLHELGLPQRRLNWGKDDGTTNHTLDEQSEQYYYGLVKYDNSGKLAEIDPDSGRTIGLARMKG